MNIAYMMFLTQTLYYVVLFFLIKEIRALRKNDKLKIIFE